MMQQLILYLGAGFVFLWGMAHLFPTRNIVAGFGEISQDNKHIITMEWIMEGVALMYVGVTVAGVTVFGGTEHLLGTVYYLMAAVSSVAGAKVNFLPFKLCVPIMLTSAGLFLWGSFMK